MRLKCAISRRKLSICLVALVFFVTPPVFAVDTELTLYTYDSFLAKGGLGPTIFPIFEKKFNCKVRAFGVGDAGQLLTKLQLDAANGKTQADLVLGLDMAVWQQAKSLLLVREFDFLTKLKREVREKVLTEPGFVPFDYGFLTFMAQRDELKKYGLEPPKSLKDLLKPGWKRKIILEDPKASTPGLAFLLYTKTVLGEGAINFWKSLRTQWLTLAPGWDAAYQLFMRGEAPLVWSYLTSQAYHTDHDKEVGSQGKYFAVVLEEGLPVQIEGAALIRPEAFKASLTEKRKNSRVELGTRFLEFLLSEEVQKWVPTKNWMFPVVEGSEVPASFRTLPKPGRLVHLPSQKEEIDGILQEWNRALRSES